MEERRTELLRMMSRMRFLNRHEGLFLLRSSMGVSKLLYLLRSSPCFQSEAVGAFDESLRVSLSEVTNCQMTPGVWSRAVLPQRWGGLGVRSVSGLAVSAYLASVAASEALVSAIPSPPQLRSFRTMGETAARLWGDGSGGVPIPTPRPTAQRWYDDLVCGERFKALLAETVGSGGPPC